MTPRETNVLLTQAALLDGRLRREPEERAQMATAWSRLLSDVPFDAASWAIDQHYRQSNALIMPADIIALAVEMPAPVVAAVDEGRAWLEARGIDPDEFERRLADGDRPTRALRELSAGGE